MGTNGIEDEWKLRTPPDAGRSRNTLVSFVPRVKSGLHIGIDDDTDGYLSIDEVDETVYVCNGADGEDGADGTDGGAAAFAPTVVARRG